MMKSFILAAAIVVASGVGAFAQENNPGNPNAADAAPVLYAQRNAILDQLTSAQVEINKLKAELEKAKAENKCAEGEKK